MKESQRQNQEKNTQKTQKGTYRVAVLGSTRALCFAAILAAMSIVLGKFLQIPNPFQEFIRISFENLPILLAGLTMGPISATLIAVVADLLGCVLYGYSINPLITLGAAAVGLTAGLIGLFLKRKPLLLRVILATVTAHIVGSVLIKSAGLAAWYLSKYELGYWEFVGWRGVNYALVATAEALLLYLLLRNRALQKQFERMC